MPNVIENLLQVVNTPAGPAVNVLTAAGIKVGPGVTLADKLGTMEAAVAVHVSEPSAHGLDAILADNATAHEGFSAALAGKADKTALSAKADTLTMNTELAKKVNAVSGVLTAPLETRQTLGSISGARVIDCDVGHAVSATVSGNTAFSFSGIKSTGSVTLLLELKNAGAFTVTWPASIKWSGGTAPTLTRGVDVVVLYTSDGGATLRGVVTSYAA